MGRTKGRTCILARLGMERLLQEALEREVTEYLGREHYECRAPCTGAIATVTSRASYVRRRGVRVQAPQVREAPETYRPRLLEHLEERRRTKVIPRFFTEKSCLKLVFATLWRASLRWQGVRMTEVEQEQLAQLRQGLGIVGDRAAAEAATNDKAA